MKEKDLASSIIQRQFWIIIILIIGLIGSNIGWLIYESQFETIAETETVEQEISGIDYSNITQNGISK